MSNQEASKPQRVHIIPVGHPEPLHEASENCWCKPLLKESGSMAIHNAKDCREKWERQGIIDQDKQWILAYENLKGTLPATTSPVVTCAYCGHEYPDGTPTSKNHQLTQHIKVCEKHPLRNAEKRIRDLEQALVDAKLDRDRAVLEAREIIQNVGAASINNYNHYRLAREWMQRWFPQ